MSETPGRASDLGSGSLRMIDVSLQGGILTALRIPSIQCKTIFPLTGQLSLEIGC